MSDFDEIRNALSGSPDGDVRTYGGIHALRAEAVLKWHYRKTQRIEQERDDARQAINRALIHLHLLGQPAEGSPLERAWNTLASASTNPVFTTPPLTKGTK